MSNLETSTSIFVPNYCRFMVVVKHEISNNGSFLGSLVHGEDILFSML